MVAWNLWRELLARTRLVWVSFLDGYATVVRSVFLLGEVLLRGQQGVVAVGQSLGQNLKWLPIVQRRVKQLVLLGVVEGFRMAVASRR